MLELEHGFRVVDANAQLEPDPERRPRERIGDPEQLGREMHQAGIVRAAVSPPAREGGYLKANNAIARHSVGRPMVPLARINGTRDPGSGPGARLRNLASSREDHHTTPEDVEQYAYDGRFAGFVLHPAEDGLPDEAVLEQLAAVDLSLVVHAGRSFPPAMAAETVLTYDVETVLAGFGGYPLDRKLMAEAIDLLEMFDDCYLDTSFVRFRDVLERATVEHPDRVLFASGAPHTHPNVAVMEILTLNVPEDAMRRIFAKNPGRVIEDLAPRSL